MSDISLTESERGSHGSLSLHDRSREEAVSVKPAQQEETASLWDDLKAKIVFSLTTYRTSRELRVRNRNLGYMSTISIALIMGYFIIYIFLIGRFFMEHKKTTGSPLITIHGKAFYEDNVYNLELWELSQRIASGSPSSTTFPTRVRITREQTIGTCPTPLIPCKRAANCNPNDYPNFNIRGRCSEISEGKKACEVNDWCPAENIDDSDVTEVIDLEGVSEQKISIKSIMSFPDKPAKVYAGNSNKKQIDYPQDQANTFSVENLLTLAGTNYDSVKLVGCILQLNIIWYCNVDTHDCKTNYEVKRIDGGTGYSQKHARYTKDGDTTSRDLIHYSGIKVIVAVLGISERVSIYYIFLYFFLAISLIYGVQLGTDFFLLHVAREKRHYSELKFETLRPDRPT